jgi:hypothetical protein
MGKRKGSLPATIAGREQTHLKQFLLRLFEDGCPPDEALQKLRTRFDSKDFARVREAAAKLDATAPKDIRGPRGKG